MDLNDDPNLEKDLKYVENYIRNYLAGLGRQPQARLMPRDRFENLCKDMLIDVLENNNINKLPDDNNAKLFLNTIRPNYINNNGALL